jgi:hypothetical protein
MEEYIKRLLACAFVLSVKMQTENPPVSARDIGCDEETFLAVEKEAKEAGYIATSTFGPDGALVTVLPRGRQFVEKQCAGYVREYYSKFFEAKDSTVESASLERRSVRIEIEHDAAHLDRPLFMEVEKIPPIGSSIPVPGGKLIVKGIDERRDEIEKDILVHCDFFASV